MKKEENAPYKFNSISDLHRAVGLTKPLHPLISLVDSTVVAIDKGQLPTAFLLNFYKISYKQCVYGKIKYGQNYYDFDEGGMVFTSPNQLMAVTHDTEYMGHTLLIHPDFIANYPLGKNIKNLSYFSYEAIEALHLSEKEKIIIIAIFKNIEAELQSTIDDFSQDIIVAQIELLLSYSKRFYKRQFITRKLVSNDLFAKLEGLCNDYFNKETALMKSLPTVQFFAEQLNVSSHYLSDMLRSLTGHNTQQYIHEKLIEKAKEVLSISNLSVAEVAYQLGFEHPQSFNKLFKSKTNLSPLEYRKSLN